MMFWYQFVFHLAIRACFNCVWSFKKISLKNLKYLLLWNRWTDFSQIQHTTSLDILQQSLHKVLRSDNLCVFYSTFIKLKFLKTWKKARTHTLGLYDLYGVPILNYAFCVDSASFEVFIQLLFKLDF